MGGSISILTKESYYYELSRDMTHAAWGFYDPCVKYYRPFDGSMMDTDIECVPTHTFQLHFTSL